MAGAGLTESEATVQPCECGRVLTSTEHHCWFHHTDEHPEGAFMVCFECGHVYRTKRALRQAYRRALRQMQTVRWRSTSWELGRFRYLWRLLTVRARTISFCQECVHDF